MNSNDAIVDAVEEISKVKSINAKFPQEKIVLSQLYDEVEDNINSILKDIKKK